MAHIYFALRSFLNENFYWFSPSFSVSPSVPSLCNFHPSRSHISNKQKQVINFTCQCWYDCIFSKTVKLRENVLGVLQKLWNRKKWNNLHNIIIFYWKSFWLKIEFESNIAYFSNKTEGIFYLSTLNHRELNVLKNARSLVQMSDISSHLLEGNYCGNHYC